MWLFTETGFFSVVTKSSDRDTVKIRARVREDLVQLIADHFPEELRGIGIVDTASRDYPYRVFVSKATLAEVMMSLAQRLDYTNFKSHVGMKQGYPRAHLYSEVWGVMNNAEKKLRRGEENGRRTR